MYMDLPPNKYKTISFSTTTMTSLGFIPPPVPKILGSPLNLAPPPSKFFFFLLRSSPLQLLWSEIFRYSPKISGEGLLPWLHHIFPTQYLPLPRFCQNLSSKLFFLLIGTHSMNSHYEAWSYKEYRRSEYRRSV